LFTQDLTQSLCEQKDGLVYNSKPNDRGTITNYMKENPVTEEVDALVPGDHICVEVDNEAGTVTFFRNGIQQGRCWENLEDTDWYGVLGARGVNIELSLTELLEGDEFARRRPGDWAVIATDTLHMGDDVPKPFRDALRLVVRNRANTYQGFCGASYYPHAYEAEPEEEEEDEEEKKALEKKEAEKREEEAKNAIQQAQQAQQQKQSRRTKAPAKANKAEAEVKVNKETKEA